MLLVGDGTSIHVTRFIRGLSDRGLEVHVASPNPARDNGAVIHPVEPRRLGAISRPWNWPRYLRLWWSARRTIGRANPDLVHIHAAMPYTLAYALAAGHRPVVLTLWGSDVYVVAQKNLLRRWILRGICRHADLVMASSQVLIDAAAHMVGGFRRTLAFAWGFDDETFSPGRPDPFPADIHIPANARLLLSGRAAKPIYRIDKIIEAFSGVARNQPDIHLLVLQGTGSDDYVEGLIQQVSGLGIGHRVEFVRRLLTPREMAQVLRRSDAMISIPTSDALGATIMEAMGVGCTPILWDLPAYAPLKSLSAAIHFVADTDQLATAMSSVASSAHDLAHTRNPSAARQLGTWRTAVDQTVEAYDQLMNSSSRG